MKKDNSEDFTAVWSNRLFKKFIKWLSNPSFLLDFPQFRKPQNKDIT